MGKMGWMLALLTLLILWTTGCSSGQKKLVIGMVPYDNPVQAENNFKPIKEYLQVELGLSIEVIVTSDYLSLIDGMKHKKVDIGWYGPFSYVAGELEVKMEPLVVQYRRSSGVQYYSQIITRNDSAIRTLEDLEGKRMAFVDPGSTSGFVIPIALFKSRGIDPQKFFGSVSYAGTHEAVAMDVASGKVDAGAMDDIVYNSLLDSGKLRKGQLRSIWISEAIPGSPYTVRDDLDKRLKNKFKTAMLAIHEKNPEALRLHDSRVEKFVECDSTDYNSIRNTARILGDEFVIERFLKKK